MKTNEKLQLLGDKVIVVAGVGCLLVLLVPILFVGSITAPLWVKEGS